MTKCYHAINDEKNENAKEECSQKTKRDERVPAELDREMQKQQWKMKKKEKEKKREMRE